MKQIEVTAAVIRRDDKVFAVQRGYGEFKGGWEFPGGKIEPHELPEEALKREIQEELNTLIAPGEKVGITENDYPGFHLRMHVFMAEIISGSLELLEAQDARWLNAEQLEEVDWLPADRSLIPKIREILNRQ